MPLISMMYALPNLFNYALLGARTVEKTKNNVLGNVLLSFIITVHTVMLSRSPRIFKATVMIHVMPTAWNTLWRKWNVSPERPETINTNTIPLKVQTYIVFSELTCHHLSSQCDRAFAGLFTCLFTQSPSIHVCSSMRTTYLSIHP